MSFEFLILFLFTLIVLNIAALVYVFCGYYDKL